MVYQGATGLYHFLINVIPFISNSVLHKIYFIPLVYLVFAFLFILLVISSMKETF